MGPSVGRVLTAVVIWTVAGGAGAGGQVLPDSFQGVWQNMEGRKTECRRSDWNSANHSDTHILVAAKEYNGTESFCRFKGIKQNPSGAVRLELACAGEGEEYATEEIWSVAEVQGRRLLIKTSLEKQTFHTQVYQHCPG